MRSVVLAAALGAYVAATALNPPIVVGAAGPATPAASVAVERPSLAAAVEAFRHKIALNPFNIDGDPYRKYAGGEPFPMAPPPEEVCAIRYEPDKIHYTLRAFSTADDARHEGYIVTHQGVCGTCSTLQDLATYLARPDLTTPVRSCAMYGITHGGTLRCLENLGFTHACAETWYYNSANTRRHCFRVCLSAWISGEPSNKPDGSVNDCVRCDEEHSGRIFELVAGRTRRNSGIQSSVARAQSELYPLVHDYF